MPNESGQGSLEYLLIVAGAIALAAMIIYVILNSGVADNASTQEVQRRKLIADECVRACNDYDYCTRKPGLGWTDSNQCEADCKKTGYENTQVNATECQWDCRAYGLLTSASLPCSDSSPPGQGTPTLSNSGGWEQR